MLPRKRLKLDQELEIAYIEAGEGKECILFLHGLSCYADIWQKNLPTLSENYRCIAIDLPGNGYSSKGNYPFSIFFYAEKVVQFMRQMDLQEVYLCGHSMGGHIAQLIALRYPQLVKRLILAAPAGFEEFTAAEQTMFQGILTMGTFLYSDEASLTKTLQESFFHFPEEANGMISEIKEAFFKTDRNYYRAMVLESVKGMMKEPVWEFLPQISCPVLLFFGLEDRLIPIPLIHRGTTESLAKAAAARIKECELKLFKSCGHFIQWEKASELNSDILKFLGRG